MDFDFGINSLFIKSKLYLKSFFVAFLVSSFWVEPVFAQQGNDFGVGAVGQYIQLGGGNLIAIIGSIINIFLGFLGIITLVMMVYGGYLIMTSGGEEDKVRRGRDTLINAVIGLAIILASFAIVNFFINAFSDATRTGADKTSRTGSPNFQSYAASGALGDAIESHYPRRNQTDVPRNTKISVTFSKDISTKSILKNSNDTCWGDNGPTTTCNIKNGKVVSPDVPYYGDCLKESGGSKNTFEEGKDCDQIRTNAIKLAATSTKQIDAISSKNQIKLVGMAQYSEGKKAAKDFVFRPIATLGNNNTKEIHSVHLTNKIKEFKPNKKNEQALGSDGYKWQFEVATDFDYEPPKVINVHPDLSNKGNTSTIYKNEIISITFNEPIDPTRVQGTVNTGTSQFTNIIFNNTSTIGSWEVTNGYRTVEFKPSGTCGVNSCGDPLYCFDIDCPKNKKSCKRDYTVLARTAKLLNPNSNPNNWEGQAQSSGIMDMAGNVLDGSGNDLNGDGNKDGKPSIGNKLTEIDPQEKAADNFYWNFEIRNKIDRRMPYIKQIEPKVDADNLPSDKKIKLHFNMSMWKNSLDNIDLVEFNSSSSKIINPATGSELEDIWYYFDSQEKQIQGGADKTITEVKHRDLGPNGLDLFYVTKVSSSVKGVNQNCLYPGRGPDQTNNCQVVRDKNNNVVKSKSSNCVIDFSGYTNKTDTGCPYGSSASAAKSDINACSDFLRKVNRKNRTLAE